MNLIRLAIASISLTTALSGEAAFASPGNSPLAIRVSDPGLAWGPCPPIFPGACQIAVLNGDPAKPNADVFLRVGPGYVLPAHSHTSAERMVLVEGQLQVGYDGSPTRILKVGNYAYGPAGLPHEAKCLSRSRCPLFIAFEGPVDAKPVTAKAR